MTISGLVVLLPVNIRIILPKEGEGIIAPFAKPFATIYNCAYYSNVNFFLKTCHKDDNISSMRKSDVEFFLGKKIAYEYI